MDRQRYMLDFVLSICDRDFQFQDYEACREVFKNIINDLKQMNYSEFKSEAFYKYSDKVTKYLEEHVN